MFDSSNIIVGLEIGTSKVCAVVGELNAAGNLNIIGLGQARSRGVRKGEISDPNAAEEDVRNALDAAEKMSNAEIRSVYLGVTGNHIRGFNNRGVHPVVSADREITEEDVQDVIKNAKAINLPTENTVVHAIRQHFHIDGQDGILNPIGMFGARVEVDVHVIHGNYNRLQNSIRLVTGGLQMEVETVVFNGMAASLALLSSEQKEVGSLVIDFGGGTTEYVVYCEGIIKHTGVLALGGDHVSHDLAIGLKVPMGRAEQLKIEHGSALLDESVKGQTVTISGEAGQSGKTISLEHLRQIMSLRIDEIFRIIEQDLARVGLLDYVNAVFICGGGARIPQIQKLAENVFQLAASIGKANSINGLTSALDQPEFATAIGLAKFGSLQQKRRKMGGLWSGGLKTITEIFQR